MVLATHRDETDAAIAEQDRRRSIPEGRREFRIPYRLTIINRCAHRPIGRHEQTARAGIPSRRSRLAADFGNEPTADSDITGERHGAGVIDDRSSKDDQIMHDVPPDRAAQQGDGLDAVLTRLRSCYDWTGLSLSCDIWPHPGSRRNSARCQQGASRIQKPFSSALAGMMIWPRGGDPGWKTGHGAAIKTGNRSARPGHDGGKAPI